MAPALRVRDVEVSYGRRRALTGVSFDLEPGSTLAVIGPNGSGKSTLLQAIVGLVPLAAGSIEVGGASVALVLQSTDVDRATPITVRDTVAMARYPAVGLLGRFRPDDRAAVTAAMAATEVADLAPRSLQALSGGQRQRVLLAQGLAQEAEVLLLDEPVTGLDPASRRMVLDVIAGQRAAGAAVVMTTHDLEDARLCDRVLLLANRSVALGTPERVITEAALREAFGSRVLPMGREFVMDDPHHHDRHDHHPHRGDGG